MLFTFLDNLKFVLIKSDSPNMAMLIGLKINTAVTDFIQRNYCPLGEVVLSELVQQIMGMFLCPIRLVMR